MKPTSDPVVQETDRMTPAQALAIVTAHESFTILKYQSQDGCLWDIEATLLPYGENYYFLVRRALGQLDRIPRPPEIAPEVWHTALEEQRSSWLKSLAENPDSLQEREQSVRLSYELLNPRDVEEGFNLNHLICERTLLAGEEKQPKAPVPIAKKYIREQTELGKYIGKLQLSYGKFESVVPGKPL